MVKQAENRGKNVKESVLGCREPGKDVRKQAKM